MYLFFLLDTPYISSFRPLGSPGRKHLYIRDTDILLSSTADLIPNVSLRRPFHSLPAHIPLVTFIPLMSPSCRLLILSSISPSTCYFSPPIYQLPSFPLLVSSSCPFLSPASSPLWAVCSSLFMAPSSHVKLAPRSTVNAARVLVMFI